MANQGRKGPRTFRLQGNAWARTAVVAIGVAILVLLAVQLSLGAPTSVGVGRVVGVSILPYILTALVVRRRPKLHRWGPLIAVYLAFFLILFLITGVSMMSSV